GGPSPRPGRQRQNRRQPRRCQPSTALGPDQEEVVFPFLVQPPNVEPKQVVPSSKASTTLGTEGNLELLAEEQVVHDEALRGADGGDECVEEELDEFEHRGGIADPRSRLDRRMGVWSATGLGRAGSVYDFATPSAP